MCKGYNVQLHNKDDRVHTLVKPKSLKYNYARYEMICNVD